MGGWVVRLKRLAQFRVAIGLFGKTQVGHSQVLKFLAIAFVLLCLGEHIGRSQAVCISTPHHWRCSNVAEFQRPRLDNKSRCATIVPVLARKAEIDTWGIVCPSE